MVSLTSPSTLSFLVLGIVIILTFLWRARIKLPTLRPIAAIEAIPEMVGRAVEMGRPILFLTNARLATSAGGVGILPILSYIARQCGKLKARVVTSTCYSETQIAAQATVQAAYVAEGSPELYNPDDVKFWGGRDGDKPGTLSLIAGGGSVPPAGAAFLTHGGMYSIFHTEAAKGVGAMTSYVGNLSGGNLAFALMANDYCILAEEYYAASATLAADKTMIGTIVGQDVIKLISILLILVGLILTHLGYTGLNTFLKT